MAYKDNDISDLIPDYCNKRLDAKEEAYLESLLQDDHELSGECKDFQEFQQLYRRIDPAEPSPSDAIFNRISREIGLHQKVEKKAYQSAEPLRCLWQRIRESIAVPWMLAAAQALVILILLVPAPDQNTYSTLSTTEMAADGEKTGINVVFRPSAPESDIRSLLLGIQGSVSSGPSMEGRYVITISKRGDLEKAVQTLKQSEIVIFAEPVN